MSITKTVIIGVGIIGDGVTNSFSLDLLKDPYVVTNQGASTWLDGVVNWFAHAKQGSVSLPIGVNNGGSSAFSCSLSGTVVTITFTAGNIPSSYQLVSFYVTFA